MYRYHRFMYAILGFSRSQANGFLIFLPLVLLVMFSEPIYRRYVATRQSDRRADIAKLDSLIAIINTSTEIDPQKEERNEAKLIVRRSFDPNTAPKEVLEQLGISPAIAVRIVNYRSKGGRFRKKEDLLAIYGFDSAVFVELKPFIVLAGAVETKNAALPKNEISRKHTFEAAPLDINTADSAALRRVNGIGEKLSARILKYREALGGFVSMNQLAEVYKLDTLVVSTLQKRFFIRPGFVPKQLDVNSAERQEFAIHPYLSSKAAAAIVAYRFQHGRFTSIGDLSKIPAIDSTTFKKLTPYLKLSVQD